MGSESSIFARTKAQVPQPMLDLIGRPSVEASLAEALCSRSLVLLLAPAGWGKTCALSRQVALLAPETRTAWVTLDADDDLPRFIACIATALAPLELAWSVSPAALTMMAEGERGLHAIGDQLINALDELAEGRGLLVFDDLHRVDDLRVHELIGYVAEHLPERWSVAIGSRAEPRFPLSRLRVRGQMAEFRQGQLQFTRDDIDALARRGALPEGDTTELLRQTEGWPAGVRLLLSTSGNKALAPGESSRHVFDYLAEEVMTAMEPELQDFLMRCSVLHELSAERCAMVSGMPQAQELFERVERDGLFVTPLGGVQPTLRMHDLFRDFLQMRLQREHADELPGLLERAGRSEEDLLRAARFLSRAGAWETLARRIIDDGRALLAKGAASTLRRLVNHLPPEVRSRHPHLQFLLGLAAYSSFDFEGLVKHTTEAVEGFSSMGDPEQAALAHAFLCIGQHNTGNYAAGTAGLERLRNERHAPSVDAIVQFHSAWNAYSDGRGADVARHYAQALEHFERLRDPGLWEWVFFQSMFAGLPGMDPLLERFDVLVNGWVEKHAGLNKVWLQHTRAARALCAGRVEDAHARMQETRAHLAWLGWPRSCTTEHLMLGILLSALKGDRDDVLAAVRELEDVMLAATPGNQRAHLGSVHCSVLRAWWLLGDKEGVREAAAAMETDANSAEWPVATRERALGRALVALGDGAPEVALQALEGQLPELEDNLYCRGSQMRLTRIAALCAMDDLDTAATELREWLRLVLLGAPVGGLLLAGAPVRECLAAADWGRRLPKAEREALERLLAQAAEHPSRIAEGEATTEKADLRAEGLTAREESVLALLADGLSNKVIARQLELSPHTVKRHVANILSKTGSGTRTQAAAWYLAKAAYRT